MKNNSLNLSFFDEKLAIKNFDNNNNRVVGYARLSFDEDGAGYCSIVNQQDLLQGVYDNGFKKDNSTYSFLADDNVSGYKFDRPNLKVLLSMIEQGKCNIILAKDLSRIGRHGALTQLFIEQCEKIGIRVYAMDDYDSHKESDDLILGIKTWSNERYVKDASQKVRKIVKHKQENGTWICNVPFGYYVNDYQNPEIKVNEDAANVVRKIFNMYLNGNGINKIARTLSENKIPTPTMFEMNMAISKGKHYKRKVSVRWTPSVISTILRNDFYIGVLRTGKYTRRGINGADVRKNSDSHYVFEDNHEGIVNKETFNAVQKLWEQNKKEHYRNKGVEHLFHGILECGDCGSKLYCYSRPNLATQYVCSQYFKYGTNACSRHRVKESLLIEIAAAYTRFVKENCVDAINNIGIEISKAKNEKNEVEKQNKKIDNEIESAQNELNVIEEQRIKQIIAHPERESSLNTIYDNLHNKTIEKIESLQKQKKNLDDSAKGADGEVKKALTALEMLECAFSKDGITRNNVVALFEKITVYADGRISVKTKPYLNGFKSFKVKLNEKALNHNEEFFDIKSENEVVEGDPSHTTFIKYLSMLKGINILSENIRKKGV